MLNANTNDPLEKCFSNIRHGSGGTYFITAQSVIEKVQISRAKLFILLNFAVEGTEGHCCAVCTRKLSENKVEVGKNLIALEAHVPRGVMLAILYVVIVRC